MKTINQISFLRDPQIPGIEVCHIKNSSHVFPTHSHDDIYAFSLMLDGGSYWNKNETTDDIVKPGDIALINPGLVHSGAPVNDKSYSYEMVYIDVDLMKSLTNEICESQLNYPEFESVVIKNESLKMLYRQLFSTFLMGSDSLEKESTMLDFLGQLINDHCVTKKNLPIAGKEPIPMKRAFEFLSQQLDKKISLEDVASAVGISRYHFLRVFKKNTGVTPHSFRTQKRIEKSKTMILSGFPLSEVALTLGFTDQSHLTNTFRNYTGATPGQYFLNK